MSCLTLPASPNWYNSKTSDSNDKTFVFGARQSVYVYRFDVESLDILQLVWTFTEHRDRVSSVTLCQLPSYHTRCSSGDEEGRVKVWDVVNREVYFEHKIHSGKVTAISWSPLNCELIVSGDDKGGVVTWELETNSPSLITPEPGAAVLSIACSPINGHNVAIGYKTGLVLLISLERQGQIIHRLRGHDDEVHSLAWCSFPGDLGNFRKKGNDPEKENEDDCLLASGCKDRTIIVWSTSRGRAVENLKLPTNTGSRRERWDEQGRTRVWLTICWPENNPSQFISSSHNGDLLMWDLCKTGRNKWELMSPQDSTIPCHSRIVFNISTVGSQYIISTSMDRQVIVWNLHSKSPIFSMATLGGFVYTVESSSLDPGQVAVGVGDNLIRIWNINDKKNLYNVTTLWQGIKSKVTSLAWHPSKEGSLAYGTDDGRVGIYNILSNKPPQVSSTYHRRTVYVVKWGPACPSIDCKSGVPLMCVYSVGDGVIKEHIPTRMEAEAVDIHSLMTKTNGQKVKYPIRSEISWRQDFSLVAVGNDDGSVEIYTPPDFRLVAVIRLHQKLINCVRWHPPFTAASPSVSPCRDWLATGSNENSVYVVDLHHVIEELPSANEAVTLTTSIARLDGHSGRITGLSWSPHTDGQLVSASYDGTAQVWDVTPKQAIANFRGHTGKLLCCEWSPLEANLVLSGGDDFCLHLWDITQQEHKTCPPSKKKGKGKSKSRQKVEKAIEVCPPSGNEPELPVEIQEMLEAKRRQLTQQSDSSRGDNIDDSGISAEDILGTDLDETGDTEISRKGEKNNECQNTRRSVDQRKKRRPKSIFPVLSSRENCPRNEQHEDLLRLIDIVYNLRCSEEGDSHLGLYLSRRDVFRCLKKEGIHHKNHDNMDYHLQLEIWKGNIKGALKVAGEREELTDWLVAMAPMASQQTWIEACVDYGRQLETEGQFHKAASYLLAAHKVYDAINLFRRHNMFREAVGIAKLRLSPLDPIHEDLYSTWGQLMTKEGHFEQAAKCYVAIKQIQEAAKLVARRGDEGSLRTAARMNFRANDNQEGLIYSQKLLNHYLLAEDWGKVREFCGDNKQLKGFVLLASLHQLLLQELVKVESRLSSIRKKTDGEEGESSGLLKTEGESTLKIPEFIVDLREADKLSPWQPYLVENQTFLQRVLRMWCTHFQLSMDMVSLEGVYRVLQTVHQKQNSTDIPQLLISVSSELSQAILCLLLGDTPVSIRHFVSALSSVQNTDHSILLQTLCRLCFPLGPNYVLKLQHEVTALRVLLNIDTSEPFSAATKSHTTKKYWSEAKEDDLISNSNHRCRELDSLRAFYYQAVLFYIQGELTQAAVTNSYTQPQLVQESKGEITLDAQQESVENRDDKVDNTPTTSLTSSDPLSLPADIPSANEDNKDISRSNVPTVISPDSSVSNPHTDTGTSSPEFSINLALLKNLSKNVLWDVQAKRFALLESLGYVHRAMSKLLLSKTASNSQHDKTEETGVSLAENKCVSGEKDVKCTDPPALPLLPPDVVLGLPEQDIPLICHDYDSWKSPLSDESQTAPVQIPSPFHEYTKPKKILWKDDTNLTEVSRRRSMDFTCGHSGVPSDWLNLPVDERYSQPYVTQDILQQEEDFIKSELLRGPDSDQMMFPKPLGSVSLLLTICGGGSLCEEERLWLEGKLIDWALFFAVTSNDKERFKKYQKKL